MLKNGLLINILELVNSANASEKIVHFPLIRHQQYMVIQVITIKRIIFHLLHTVSLSWAIFFYFPPFFLVFFFSFQVPFLFRFRIVIYFAYSCICLYKLYYSIYKQYIRYFSAFGRFISHERQQHFQSKKKIIHFNNSIWSFGTRSTEQRKPSQTKDIIKIVEAK